MKKIILSFVFISCITGLYAQTGFHAGVNLGICSPVIINQNNYGFSEMDYKIGITAYPGLALGYNFNTNNGVQLELNYAPLGQEYFDVIRDFGPTDLTGKAKKVDTYRYVSLNYLQIPVMYRFQTTREKKEKISFHLMAGPSFGLLLSADQYYEADVNADGNIVELGYELAPESAVSAFAATAEVEAPEEYFQKMDIGFQLDAGVDIYLNENLYLTPALKLYYGFTDINSEPTRDTNEYSASKNAFGAISVGIHYMMLKEKKKK